MKSIIFLLVAFLLIAGCSNSSVDGAKGDSKTVTFDGGEATVTSGEDANDWCNVGSSMDTTTGNGNSQNIIVGIETSGKYAGYCHGVYTMQTSGNDMRADYYYDENGDGYTVTQVNGNTYESEYHTK